MTKEETLDYLNIMARDNIQLSREESNTKIFMYNLYNFKGGLKCLTYTIYKDLKHKDFGCSI